MRLFAALATVRRWAVRREVLVFAPAALLAGMWIGGEAVLLAATVLAPALYVILPPAVPGGTPRDSLTGLPLAPALVAAVDAVFADPVRSGRTTVVFAIGIDDFAAVRDRYGLHAAEQVERLAADRIGVALRRGDILVRLGAGQFAAAFAPVARADLDIALDTAARIQAAVREPVLAETAHLHVTCSVGFCLAGRAPRPSGEAALAAARDALAEARASGNSAVRAYAPARPRPASREGVTPDEATAALESGQIRPWFQPQVSTDTGAVSGFEALARWQHPTRGTLPPPDFLPALAEAGQLERLGEVILFHGLTAMRDWERAGHPVPTLGVNFSAEELRNPRLAEKLAWELDRFDLAPARLTVEILETVMADPDDDSIAHTIAALARLGCRIDLDDFGTGNASIAALRRFSVDRIKIDRSFVLNVDEDRAQQQMVAAIIGMAERLGLDTLAEGVERTGEHATLATLGCGHVQGYGIARPMPLEETVPWMERHAARIQEARDLLRRAV